MKSNMSTSASTVNTRVIMKKKKEKYLVFDKDDKQHEYTIIKKELEDNVIKYTMKRSNGEQWNSHVRGEKLFTIIDTDFQIKIKAFDSNLNDMPYHNMIELMVLLDFVNKQSYLPSRYKFVRVNND